MNQFSRFSAIVAVALSTSFSGQAHAHFPWLIVNEDGHAEFFFGEGLTERNYQLPPGIAKATLSANKHGETSKVQTTLVDSDSFVGLKSKAPVPTQSIVFSQTTFGVYHDARLEYYTQCFAGQLPKNRSEYQPVGLALQACVVDQSADDKLGVDVYVLWQGEPLEGAEVKLYCEDGHEEGAATTDAEGKVSFDNRQVEDGINGLMVGHKLNDESGKIGDQAYSSASHYLTATFVAETVAEPAKMAASSSKTGSDTADIKAAKPAGFAKLPFGITSFGAARLGDAIYVYGGHTGNAHSYSNEGQSQQLLKLNLNHPEQPWQVVAEGERVQGLGMVAFGSRLIMIGGFQARNEEGEEQDLHSIATVRAFDVKTSQWSDLPSLPAGRSSHDAVLVGDTLYVVGGWLLNGNEETQWHTTALAMDLSQPNPQWNEIEAPSFKRRALALAAHDGKLFVIGGMNSNNGPTRAVEVYDPSTNTWISGPEIIGETGMDGFGASAWSVNGQLTVTNIQGDIQVLNADGKSWNSLGTARDARFFHRLLPLDPTTLVSVGGANMESGKFLEPEMIEVK